MPKGKLPNVTVRDQGDVLDTGLPGGVTADCPGNQLTMTGGAYLGKPGKGPSLVGARRGRITGSTLIDSAEKWRVNFSEGKLERHSIALCVPENKIDGVNINQSRNPQWTSQPRHTSRGTHPHSTPSATTVRG